MNRAKWGTTIIYIHEHTALLMAKERMEGALRQAEHVRALRLARPPRRLARIYLGMALVRSGHWIMGWPSPAPRTPVALLKH